MYTGLTSASKRRRSVSNDYSRYDAQKAAEKAAYDYNIYMAVNGDAYEREVALANLELQGLPQNFVDIPMTDGEYAQLSFYEAASASALPNNSRPATDRPVQVPTEQKQSGELGVFVITAIIAIIAVIACMYFWEAML